MTTSSRESQHLDCKSIRKVTGSTADFGELARDCVCFANGAGGTLLIGIEDNADAPPTDQRIDCGLLDRIRKRVGELTVNVQVVPELKRHDNGGEYIALTIARSAGVASTSDGRYFLRVGDTCQPITGDDVMRLANERPATPWEEMTSQRIPRANADAAKVASFCTGLRASDRVKPSVKEKSDGELLAHYGLAEGDVLTNRWARYPPPAGLADAVTGREDSATVGRMANEIRPSSRSLAKFQRKDSARTHPVAESWPNSRRRRLVAPSFANGASEPAGAPHARPAALGGYDKKDTIRTGVKS